MIAGAERFQQSEQEPADDGAERIAHAAQHRSGKALQGEQCADIVARQGDRRDEDAGDRTDGGGAAEGQRHDGRGVDADQPRRKPVGRGGEHRLAEQGAFEKDDRAPARRWRSPPSTQKLCGWIAAPSMSIGLSPVKAGSL